MVNSFFRYFFNPNFSWGSNNFEAFSSSKTEPPKNDSDPFSGKGRYTGLEFCEDPFKDSNYRYGDPFDLENANDDPFTEPFKSDNAFAGDSNADPFAAAAANSNDPFKSENSAAKSDPFGSTFGPDITYENSSQIQDPFSKSDSDPFSAATKASAPLDNSDPFGNSFTATFNTAVPNVDPFGSNNNFSAVGSDPFSLTTLRAPPQIPTDINSNTSKSSVASVTPTTSTVSYRKEKVSTDSADSPKPSLKKKTSHSLSDFLTGSPLKSGEKVAKEAKEKKEKKHGKFHISSPLKAHKSKNSELSKSSSKSSTNENGVDEVRIFFTIVFLFL